MRANKPYFGRTNIYHFWHFLKFSFTPVKIEPKEIWPQFDLRPLDYVKDTVTMSQVYKVDVYVSNGDAALSTKQRPIKVNL